MKIKVTMQFTREPGGKERSYTFQKDDIIYIKRGFYKSVKKHLLRIHFVKGCGMPEVVYSELSLDDIEEILNSSPVLQIEQANGFIRIPVSDVRQGKQQEKLIDISMITGIQLFKMSETGKVYTKLFLKDKENSSSVLYSDVTGTELEMILQNASQNAS